MRLLCWLFVVSWMWSLSFLSLLGWSQEDDFPDWLNRMEFSFQVETDAKPMFYFQTVEPFYYDGMSTWFYQPRISLMDDDFTFNFGVGYRRLIGEGLLLGYNLFGDYVEKYGHGRVGLGIEAIGKVCEFRMNSYFGITSKRIVKEDSSSSTYERVADGLDVEIGSPIPYLPWVRVYVSGFWYDFDKFKDKKGWKLRMEMCLWKFLTGEIYTWDDNKGEQEFGGRVRCKIAFDNVVDLMRVFSISDVAFEDRDLSQELLSPVERNFNVVVERWIESTSMTVEVGRGN